MPHAAPIQHSPSAYEPAELLAAGRERLLAEDAASAEALFRCGALKRPHDPEFRYGLASACLAQGGAEDAALFMADARNLHAAALLEEHFPDLVGCRDPKVLAEASEVFYRSGHFGLCGAMLQRLIAWGYDDLALLNEYATVLSQQARMDEACAVYETLIKRQGGCATAHSSLHLLRIFGQAGPQTLHAEGQRWSQLCESTVRRRSPASPRRPGPIRIGYFSATFNRHQVGHFFLPILEAHNRERFEVFCYSQGVINDDVGSAALKAATYRNIRQLSDDQACDLIEADGIDILVDLWGHSRDHRLMVFARKPAPIQVSYLNYINTTGLEAFDYVLHADGYRAPGDQRWFSEEIVSVGPVIAPYRVFDPIAIGARTPALSGQPFTFASAAHPAKIGPEVARTWAEILKRTPGSRLELRYMLYADPVVVRSMTAQFEAFGVGADRLVFPEQHVGARFREAFQGFDLVLDPFPYQGMTTTMDALSMGVPVLALEGDYLAVRVAASALRVCGLDELVVTSVEDYIDRAVALASDPEALDAIRRRVAPGFEQSDFRQEAAFTRRLEQVFFAMLEGQSLQRAA